MLDSVFVDFLVDFMTSDELTHHVWRRIGKPLCWRISHRINQLFCKKRPKQEATPLAIMSASAVCSPEEIKLSPAEQQLLDFSQENKLEEVERLLSLSVSPNVMDQEGNTPLIHAARLRTSGMLQLLMKNCARLSINWMNSEGQTALTQSVRAGNEVTLGILLDAGAEVNFQDHQGFTALMIACNTGKHHTVDALLSHGKCDLDLKNKWGHSALHEGAKKGHLAIVMLLVCSGANIDAKDRWLNTPLFYATLHGFSHVVAYLLQVNCDVNAVNSGSRCALHMAAQCGFPRIVELLLHYGAQLDIKDVDGSTPLLIAGRHHHEDIMLKLVEAGCDINIMDDTGKNSLHNAAAMGTLGSLALVEAILKRGMHPDVVDKYQHTALVYALRRNHVQVMQCLMQHNCCVHIAIGSSSCSVFSLALRNGCSEVLALLIEAGCDTSCFFTMQQQASISLVISEDVELMAWLEDVLANPQTLQSLCRRRVRSSLSHRIQEELQTINLPKKLKDGILFKS